jgi:hypothetical protein
MLPPAERRTLPAVLCEAERPEPLGEQRVIRVRDDLRDDIDIIMSGALAPCQGR